MFVISSDTNTSPEEKEDMELLERALEKALQVRTASEMSDKDPKKRKQAGPRMEPGASSALRKDVIQSSATRKGSQTTVRSKSASLDGKLPKKPGTYTLASKSSARCNSGQSKTINNKKVIQNQPAVHHQTQRKSQQGGSAHAALATTLQSKNTTVQSKSDDKHATISSPLNERGPHSHTDESGSPSLHQQNWYVKQQEHENNWRSECLSVLLYLSSFPFFIKEIYWADREMEISEDEAKQVAKVYKSGFCDNITLNCTISH